MIRSDSVIWSLSRYSSLLASIAVELPAREGSSDVESLIERVVERSAGNGPAGRYTAAEVREALLGSPIEYYWSNR